MPMTFIALVLAGAPPTIPETCAAVVSPPAELQGWQRPKPIEPGLLPIGSAAMVSLAPATRWTIAPGRPPAAGTHGFVGHFMVKMPGTYRIAIGAPAWIDVVERGRTLASTAHAHGPACSGVGKMVDFTFAAGAHTLQLSGSTAPSTTVMIVKLR